MKNYLKVFRVRSFVDISDTQGKELPVEKFVFFDDSDIGSVARAVDLAEKHFDELSKRFRTRVCVWRALVLFPNFEEIGA